MFVIQSLGRRSEEDHVGSYLQRRTFILAKWSIYSLLPLILVTLHCPNIRLPTITGISFQSVLRLSSRLSPAFYGRPRVDQF